MHRRILAAAILYALTATGVQAAGESTSPATASAPAWADQADISYLQLYARDDKPVTGKPYSAEQITETVKTLADGNKITTQANTRVYRDNEGRVRREMERGGEAFVYIADPVAKQYYAIRPTLGRALRQTGARTIAPLPPGSEPKGEIKYFREAVRQDLGERIIEGVASNGKSAVYTIPAGAANNEQALQVSMEAWRAEPLGETVYSKVVDPRLGERTQRLSNLSVAEPDPALFRVPADYTVQDAPPPL